MKNRLIFFMTALLILTSCEKDIYDWEEGNKIANGDWKLTKISMADIDGDGDDDIIGVNSLRNKKYGLVGLYMNNSNNNTIKFEYQNQIFIPTTTTSSI